MENKSKKIIGIVIAFVMAVSLAVAVPISATGETVDESSNTTQSQNQETTQAEVDAAQAKAKAKAKKLKSAKAKYKKKMKASYTKWHKYMTAKQKTKYKAYKKKLKAAKTVKSVKKYYAKSKVIVKKAKAAKKEEHSWNGPVQASCYGPYEGECITATGRTITNSTYYVAVPISRIVSKSSWDKLNTTQKKNYFYYHEVIHFSRNGRTCAATVEDCGGFGGCGTTYNGKWCPRLFDLTPAVFHALGISGVGMVKWHY